MPPICAASPGPGYARSPSVPPPHGQGYARRGSVLPPRGQGMPAAAPCHPVVGLCMLSLCAPTPWPDYACRCFVPPPQSRVMPAGALCRHPRTRASPPLLRADSPWVGRRPSRFRATSTESRHARRRSVLPRGRTMSAAVRCPSGVGLCLPPLCAASPGPGCARRPSLPPPHVPGYARRHSVPPPWGQGMPATAPCHPVTGLCMPPLCVATPWPDYARRCFAPPPRVRVSPVAAYCCLSQARHFLHRSKPPRGRAMLDAALCRFPGTRVFPQVLRANSLGPTHSRRCSIPPPRGGTMSAAAPCPSGAGLCLPPLCVTSPSPGYARRPSVPHPRCGAMLTAAPSHRPEAWL